MFLALLPWTGVEDQLLLFFVGCRLCCISTSILASCILTSCCLLLIVAFRARVSLLAGRSSFCSLELRVALSLVEARAELHVR